MSETKKVFFKKKIIGQIMSKKLNKVAIPTNYSVLLDTFLLFWTLSVVYISICGHFFEDLDTFLTDWTLL